MLFKRLFLFILALSFCGTAFAVDDAELNISVARPGAQVGVDRVVSDDKVVVSVADEAGSPIFGLGAADFAVKQSGRTANIISAQPLAESMDVPRHIVLVLDNSYSMQERRAINALLKGVSELLKIVRPIDRVHIVVFENFRKVKMGGYELSVQTFDSNEPALLQQFAGKAYSDELITGKTVLNDAVLAGLELIKGMPDTEPRFMVVFSDGEDLNSTYKREEVLRAAEGIEGFNAYAIDYMPGPATDKFLSEFTARNSGQIWKAKTENDLVPIFQEVKSKMLYFYVVNYLFPPTGELAVAPSVLKFDEIRISDSAPVTMIADSALTLRPSVDTAYGFSKWNVTVGNAKGKVAELSGEGAPGAEITAQLPVKDAQALAAGGDFSVRMELTDIKGQDLVMDAPPVKVEVMKTSASMSVTPSALRFDEMRVMDGAPVTRMDVSALTIKPVVESVHGIANWKAVVGNAKGSLVELSGEGAPATELMAKLPDSDLQALAAGGDLSVRMELKDNKGHDLVMYAAPVKVELARTRASMSVEPSVLKFDEIKVMDGAPVTTLDVAGLTVRPFVDSAHGISKWKVAVTNAGGGVAELAGEGSPASELNVQLPAADLSALASGGDLSVGMELTDVKGHEMKMDAPPVRVELVKTWAGMTVDPAKVTIEEVRTIDASPMLAQVYFDKESSEIPARYVRFAGPSETEGFDEQKFRDSMEKYRQVLNIIGKRLTANPDASVTLVGCNDNTGKENGNKKLSTARAEAVKAYLQGVWGIAPERMSVEARNLPDMPSAKRLAEGQEENRRVEIRSTEYAILAPIQSTYITNRIDAPALTLHPEVVSPHGIADWKINVTNASGELEGLSGEGVPASEIAVPLGGRDLAALAAGGDIALRMELRDMKGHAMTVTPAPVEVEFIQTSQRLAKKEGLQVEEKYALILFDFDKSDIGPQNQKIVDGITARIKALPQATVKIVGHTDNIGRESYNLGLSKRRSAAVYELLKAAFDEDPGERLSHSGVGQDDPLYDNLSPEARSFNRTVTITLEYMSEE